MKRTTTLTLAAFMAASTVCVQAADNRRPGKRRNQSQQYSIEQAVSDHAQLHTIAFNGLAFITGDSGRTFVEEILTDEQRRFVTDIPDLQRAALMETVHVRRELSRELRKLLAGEKPDRDKVLALGRRYGELDGEMSWLYATAFAQVNRTLSEKQRTELMTLRNLEGYESAEAYRYSRPIEGKLELPDTDSFFFAPAR
jgi:Spy/CpxP family protein refolding chaperone